MAGNRGCDRPMDRARSCEGQLAPRREQGCTAARAAALAKLGGGYWGMWIAHVGMAVSLVGIALALEYSDERDVRLEPGESVAMGAYEFFEGVDGIRGRTSPIRGW